MALLEVKDLDITYETKKRTPLQAVRNVTFSLKPGEFVGLVGESGSGKSTLGSGILRLLQPPGRITGGSVRRSSTRRTASGTAMASDTSPSANSAPLPTQRYHHLNVGMSSLTGGTASTGCGACGCRPS